MTSAFSNALAPISTEKNLRGWAADTQPRSNHKMCVFVCLDAGSQVVLLTVTSPHRAFLHLPKLFSPSVSRGCSHGPYGRLLYCVCDYTGRPALLQLWTGYSLCAPRRMRGTKKYCLQPQVFSPLLLSFFPLRCLPLNFDRHLGDITKEKKAGRQPPSPGHSIPPAPDCLPACLSFKSSSLYCLEPEHKTLQVECPQSLKGNRKGMV